MNVEIDLKKIISFIAVGAFGLFSWLLLTTYQQAITLKEIETEVKFISKNVGKNSGKIVYLKGEAKK
tara:strand:+ start:188 stop:388 length:201 start_codon:yes stop_codon:yes gene_type:complete